MNIRPATEADAADIVKLRTETILAMHSPDYPPDVLDSWSKRVDVQRILKTAALVKRWVAVTREKMQETLIGFCDHTLDDNELSRLYVHHEHQGKGIGSHLLGVAEESMQEMGRKEAYLFSTTTAKEFYERHGYGVVEKTVDAHDPRIPVYRMLKKFLQK